jgi:hypothetical protein
MRRDICSFALKEPDKPISESDSESGSKKRCKMPIPIPTLIPAKALKQFHASQGAPQAHEGLLRKYLWGSDFSPDEGRGL